MAILIGIEGTDGSGKKTQTQKLYDYLTNNFKEYEVIKLSFPNYDSISTGPVKMYLGGEFGDSADSLDAYQASVLFSVDRLCTMKKLEGLVNKENVIIIFDRYVESNMLHQAGKIKDIAEVERYLTWLEELEFGYLKLPRVNQVLFLNLPVEISKKLANARTDLKSGQSKDVHESDEKHLHDAYNISTYVARRQGWNVIDCVDKSGNIKTIDEIHGMILNEVIPKIDSVH